MNILNIEFFLWRIYTEVSPIFVDFSFNGNLFLSYSIHIKKTLFNGNNQTLPGNHFFFIKMKKTPWNNGTVCILTFNWFKSSLTQSLSKCEKIAQMGKRLEFNVSQTLPTKPSYKSIFLNISRDKSARRF